MASGKQAMEKDHQVNNRSSRRRQQGQSLVVAVIVMFVLLFVGGIFVALVARNLLNTGRARETLGAYDFAMAGLRYADYYLQNSPEGADWRPAPTPPINPNDPDRRWLDPAITFPPFTRIDMGNGRALIRVTYQPGYSGGVVNPLGKYIKIESVGRSGFLNPSDPTTFSNTPAPRLRREVVGYKAIGITDFVRFVTNKDNETKFEADLGVPPIGVPVFTEYGELPVRTPGLTDPNYKGPGAPIMVNGDVNLLYNLVLAIQPGNSEAVMASGKIDTQWHKEGKLPPDNGSDPLHIYPRYVDLSKPPAAWTSNHDPTVLPIVLPSDNPSFDTFGGHVRDGAGVPDINGYVRGIPRLNPPLIDAPDPATNVDRYRALTRDSGRWFGGPGGFNTGRIAMGAGIWINNFNDQERESQGVAGAKTLRSIWLNPQTYPEYWDGPYFLPPGAIVEFGYPIAHPIDAQGNVDFTNYEALPGFRIVRDPSDRPFFDPSGATAPRELVWTFFIYKPAGQRPVIKLENPLLRNYARTRLGLSDQQINKLLPEFNGVIMAEGNIRTRGLLPSKTNMPIVHEAGDPDNLTDDQIRDAANAPAITLVSAATIYVEGSLVRENYTEKVSGRTIPGSSLALLALNSVAVNTTVLLSPNKNMPFSSSDQDHLPPYSTAIDVGEAATTPPFALSFLFGDDPTGYTVGGNPVPVYLLVRHGAPQPLAYLNLFVNEQFPGPAPHGSRYVFAPNALDPYAYSLVTFEQADFPFWPQANGGTYTLFTEPGVPNTIRPAVDPNFAQNTPVQPYLFSRAAIEPMDVRIEAVVYAENGSFFVIPGYSLNTDPSDTRDAALRRAQAAGLAQGKMLRPAGISDRYPFYGEPYDCRITIVGAVAENRTASIGDQAAWMRLWGYIPSVNGSTGKGPLGGNPDPVPDAHLKIDEVGGALTTDYRTTIEKNADITRGLRFLYDPLLRMPYAGYNPAGGQPLVLASWSHVMGGAVRQDDYGRALPPLPRLPLCPGFVFYGEVRQ